MRIHRAKWTDLRMIGRTSRARAQPHVDELDSFAFHHLSCLQRNYDQEAAVSTHQLRIIGLLVRVSLWQPVAEVALRKVMSIASCALEV